MIIRCLALLAAASAVVGTTIAGSALAATVEIEAAVRGTALDEQYDGVFEDLIDATTGGEFAIVTMGRVFGSFESERRAILEFDLSELPAGAEFLSARLTMDFVSGSTPRGAYFFYGYEGDGVLASGDADRTESLVAAQPGAGFNVDVDVSDFVQALLDGDVRWAGILGLEAVDGINGNFIAGPRAGRTLPTLVVEAPEPSAGFLRGVVLVALAGLVGFRRTGRSLSAAPDSPAGTGPCGVSLVGPGRFELPTS